MKDQNICSGHGAANTMFLYRDSQVHWMDERRATLERKLRRAPWCLPSRFVLDEGLRRYEAACVFSALSQYAMFLVTWVFRYAFFATLECQPYAARCGTCFIEYSSLVYEHIFALCDYAYVGIPHSQVQDAKLQVFPISMFQASGATKVTK